MPERPHAARLRVAYVATAMASSLLLSACSPGTGGAASTSDADGEPVVGGTYVHRVASDPTCVDPAQLRLRSALGVQRQVVDSLTFQAEDGEIEPWLAESWVLNDDATEYTFTLRDDVTFSDGTPLDAQVVVDNITTLVGMGATASIPSSYLSALTDASAPDPTTVVLDFSTPQAQFLQASSTPSLGIVAPATLALDAGARCTQGVIGTGPFTLASYRANEGMTLDRRDGYAWAPAGFENQGEAYVDSVDVVFVPDSSIGTGMLLSDQADGETDVAPQDYDRIEQADMNLRLRPMPGFPTSLFLNLEDPILTDDAVRYALVHGIDRETVVPAGSSPLEIPATGVLSASTPGYTDQSDLIAFDPEAAAEALDDAGWELGGDGVRERDGMRLSLQMNYMSPSSLPFVPVMELIQQGYGDIGIEISLNPITAAEDNERVISGDYQLRFNGLSRGDPGVLSGQFAGADPELDALLVEQAGASDPDQRTEIIQEATEHIIDEGYIVTVNDAIQGQAFRPEVRGLVFDNTNTPSFNGLWLSE